MNRIYKIISIVLLLFVVLSFSSAAQQGIAKKQIKIILKVETEDDAFRLPYEKPLSGLEIKQLRSSIIAGLNRYPDIKLVTPDEKDDAIGMLVIAEKLVDKSEYIILTSALTISKANGQELFGTHNVFAVSNLEMAAKVVVTQYASFTLRAFLK